MIAPLPIRQLVFALMAITLAPTAIANQCGEESPRLSQLGQQYYELDLHSKSDLQKLSVQSNQLIETLKTSSFDKGHGTRTLCFGASTLREESRDFVLESIESTSINGFNEMVLKAHEYETDTRTSRSESVFIPLSQSHIRLDGKNGIAANKRHRQRLNTANGSSLHEFATTARTVATGIEINQSVYVNGYLAGWVTWFLKS